jgi:hypothetical protein
MKFTSPIENTTIQALYKINYNGNYGFYPLSVNQAWHGGVHFEGNHPLVAIADGSIIAYRLNKTYLEYTRDTETLRYSSSFILIQHHYQTPNGRKLMFYSHYNHLLPHDAYNEQQKKRRPNISMKNGYIVTAKTLNVRKSTDSTKIDNITRTLKTGDQIDCTPVDDKWAKLSGVDEYIAYKGNTRKALVAVEPTFDAIVTCSTPVKANDLIGYTGIFENNDATKDLHLVHFEIFSPDDVENFITNPLGDGTTKPDTLVIAAGAALKLKEKKYPAIDIIKCGGIPAGTIVHVLNKNDLNYIQVLKQAIIRSVPHLSLDYHKVEGPGDYYTAKMETIDEISQTLDNTPITTETKLYYVATDGTHRKVKLLLPAEQAITLWVKRSALGEIKDDVVTVLTEVAEGYTDNPNIFVFEKNVVETPNEETVLLIETCNKTTDIEGITWYNVECSASGNSTINGWIAQNNPNLKIFSAYDWPGFKVAKENGDTAYDPLIDFDNLNSVFQNNYR